MKSCPKQDMILDTVSAKHNVNVYLNLLKVDEMIKWIFLDNHPLQQLFYNPEMVQNIQNIDEILQLHTNGGIIC